MPINSVHPTHLLAVSFCVCYTIPFVLSVFGSTLQLLLIMITPSGLLTDVVSHVDFTADYVCSERAHILPRAHDGF